MSTSTRRFGRTAYVLTDAEIDWRSSRLSKIASDEGVDLDADRYASVPELDLHDVERLVDAGCPLDLALEILS